LNTFGIAQIEAGAHLVLAFNPSASPAALLREHNPDAWDALKSPTAPPY
jgi:hypothetical protein